MPFLSAELNGRITSCSAVGANCSTPPNRTLSIPLGCQHFGYLTRRCRRYPVYQRRADIVFLFRFHFWSSARSAQLVDQDKSPPPGITWSWQCFGSNRAHAEIFLAAMISHRTSVSIPLAWLRHEALRSFQGLVKCEQTGSLVLVVCMTLWLVSFARNRSTN